MTRLLGLAAAGVLGCLLVSRTAEAQEEGERRTVVRYPLVVSGAFTFGLPYVVSSMVASTSELPADRFLFIPIAGPWVDLGTRPGCPDSAKTCTSETLAKIGLATDGVFQGLGALMVAGGLVFRKEVVAKTASIEIAPVAGSSFQGVRLAGAF